MNKGLVYGYVETEYLPLSSGGEIDIGIFSTTIEKLNKAGYISVDEFLDYIAQQKRETEVAVDLKTSCPITAYEFNRKDGYNYDVRVSGRTYHTLQTW